MYTIENVELNQTGRIGQGQFGMTISTGKEFVAVGSPEWRQIMADGKAIKSLLRNANVSYTVSFSKMIIIADR